MLLINVRLETVLIYIVKEHQLYPFCLTKDVHFIPNSLPFNHLVSFFYRMMEIFT